MNEVNDAEISIEVKETEDITPEEQLTIKNWWSKKIDDTRGIKWQHHVQKSWSELTRQVTGILLRLTISLKSYSLWVAKQLRLKKVKKGNKQDP